MLLLRWCDFLQNALQLFLQFHLGDTCHMAEIFQSFHTLPECQICRNFWPGSPGSTSISAMLSESKRSPSCAIRVETSKVWQSVDVFFWRLQDESTVSKSEELNKTSFRHTENFSREIWILKSKHDKGTSC